MGIDWDTDDDLEIEREIALQNHPNNVPALFEIGECSSTSPRSKTIHGFIRMGFPKDKVERAVKEHGENNEETILDALVSYNTIENLPPEEDPQPETEVPQIQHGSSSGDNLFSFFADEENYHNRDEILDSSSNEQEMSDTFTALVEMGFLANDVLTAIERCGKETPISDLYDFLCAVQMAKEADLQDEPRSSTSHHRQEIESTFPVASKRKLINKDDTHDNKEFRKKKPDTHYIPKLMIGFGVPGEATRVAQRIIPEEARGPPYFYFENVACTPKGVWSRISSFLYEIVPEFVDSKHFSAAARKRGYIHNLPIENRFLLQPIPPQTIQDAFPLSRQWWPKWDKRTKFNCILTCVGCAKQTDKIRVKLESTNGNPSEGDKKDIIHKCKKWNLIWVGKNKVAPLEPNEIESLMGFPNDHTRGCNRTDRFKGLGNSFQVDTVAYHLSVLKALYPSGINVLSLFSGIGGAEVALHRLGITLKNVVSVEQSEVCRTILQSWWEQTNQTGNLIHLPDVEQVTYDVLAKFKDAFGGFDLVIGGSPCNNLAGGNRKTRDGLEGEQSSLFYDYVRILNDVMIMMKQ